jgi:peptide/nickel transport system permease protein
MLGDSASIADQDKLRSQLGLDKPILDQLITSLLKIIQGDFGTSIIRQTPVLDSLANCG